MNLQTGAIELVINLYELSTQVNCEPGDEHYINHASFSPDGSRIVFFHIWKLFNSNKRKIRFCSYELNTSNFVYSFQYKVIIKYILNKTSNQVSI